MKPLKLSLPNSLRDELEKRLKKVGHIRDIDDRENAAAAVIADVLYSTTPKKKPKDIRAEHEMRPIREALLGMQTGDSSPAVMITNLPPTQGELFSNAMTHLFNPHVRAMVQPLDVSMPGPHHLHMEGGFMPKTPFKRLAVLYCDKPGSDPQPTIFESADEIIHAHVCEQLGLPLDAPLDVARRNPSYDTLRTHSSLS